MIRNITVAEIAGLSSPLFVDVRSEGEFAEDHIPNAINLPVFNNEERARVGTVYHQQSPEAARIVGLEILAPKLPALVNTIRCAARGKQAVIYCWRGGTRSHSVAMVLDLMNVPAYRLNGGYKQFRRHVYEYFETGLFDFKMVVLHGLTGTGKTALLSKLADSGAGAVDLEGLANHRGSVFGGVGLPDQPTQKYFESLLWGEIEKKKDHGCLVVECESKKIGRLVLPRSFFRAMQAGHHLLVYDNMDNRIRRILSDYDVGKRQEELIAILYQLKDRLGIEKTDQMAKLLRENKFDPVLRELLLEYYDPLYDYPDQPSQDFELQVNTGDMEGARVNVQNYLSNLFPR